MSSPLFILASRLRTSTSVNAKFWHTYMNIIGDYMNTVAAPSIQWISSFEAALLAQSNLRDEAICTFICMIYIMYLEQGSEYISLINMDAIKKMSDCRMIKGWILDNQAELLSLHPLDVKRAIVDELYSFI